MAETSGIATERRSASGEGERSAESIRRDIAAKRESISETVDKLGERIHQSLDWREYVVRYPLASLSLAAGTGYLVSALFRRRPSPRERILDSVADLADEFRDRMSDLIDGALPWKRAAGLKAVQAALSAALAQGAIEFGKRKAREALAAKGDDGGGPVEAR